MKDGIRRYVAPLVGAAIIVAVGGGAGLLLIQALGHDDARRIVYSLLFVVIAVHVVGLSFPKAFPRLHRRLRVVYGLDRNHGGDVGP